MSRLAVYLLGVPRFELDGEAVHIGRRKAMALLAYLAVTGTAHSREALATLLWPESTPSRGRASLRRVLVTLRQALGEGWLDVQPEILALVHPSTGSRRSPVADSESTLWLDVFEFQERVAACQTHNHPQEQVCADCIPDLTAAVELYRDDFLAGFTLPDSPTFDEWQFFLSEGLREQLASVLKRLAHWHAERGAFESAIPQARRWLALDPLHEAAHRQLMMLYARAGQHSAALRQYALCQKALVEELGVSPSEETTALYEMIRSGQFGPPQPSSVTTLLEELPSHNLPALPSLFIGRAQELADLLGLICEPTVRLVTVVGSGGMGKTRLALQAATDALGGFPEGVWLVELARVISSDAVPLAVATALGAQPQPNRDLTDTIVDSLQTRELLLLLDNCEHVLEAVAPLVDQLLTNCPQLTVLVTSREALRVAGEQMFEVPPMVVPAADEAADWLLESDAVQLFVARARAVRPSFALTKGNARFVVDICQRLDGMPLAIELAAARSRVLTPREIAARLDDRFQLLTGGVRTAPERQQTLHNTVAWSYELLDPPERALFDRLSVFRGGFTLEAAEGVCVGDSEASDDVLEQLVSLVDKSLVIAEKTEEGTMRYRLLETLRQYGAQQLQARGETETLQLQHACHFLNWVEQLEPFLDAWENWANLFRQIDPETDNLVAAMRRSLDHQQSEIALRTGSALKWWLATRTQFGQYVAWLKHALKDCDGIAPCFRAKALHAINLYSFQYDHYDEASAELAEEELAAAEQAGDPDLVALALVNMGRIAQAFGETERAQAFFQRSLDIARAIASRPRIVHATAHLAMLKEPSEALVLLHTLLPQTPHSWRTFLLLRLADRNMRAGTLSEAERYFREAYACTVELGSTSLQADNLAKQGAVAILRGDYDRAEQLLERSGLLARRCGSMMWLVSVVRLTGEMAWCRGDVDTAERRLTEALDLARRHAGPTAVGIVRCWMAYAACASGEFDRAEALCEVSLQGFLDGDVYGTGFVALTLARVAFFRGAPRRAVELFKASLHDLQLARDWLDIVRALEGLAWALVAVGNYERAAVLLAFLDAHRQRSGLVLPPVDQPHHERARAEALGGLAEEAVAAAWAAGVALTLDEAVELALG